MIHILADYQPAEIGLIDVVAGDRNEIALTNGLASLETG
jgi:hypothetical protein